VFVLCRPEKEEERGWAWVAGESTPEPRRTTKEKMRNQADRKRYLIGLLGERGKAKKNTIRASAQSDPHSFASITVPAATDSV
jgi:hypothetical protein